MAKKKPVPTKKKLYELTDEHRAQLKPWADRWIANAMSTAPMTDAERDAARVAVNGLYEAAKLDRPENIVFCASPITGSLAAGIAAGVWYLREHPEQHVSLFGRRLTEGELMAAIAPACRIGVAAAKRRLASLEEAPVAPPTHDATRDATDAATRAATSAATYAATRAATYAATSAATRAATYAATSAATDAATRDAGSATRFLLGCLSGWWSLRNGGNQWAGWGAYLSFFRHVAKLELPIYEQWKHYERLMEISGPRFMHARFWIVSDFPTVVGKDDRNRPHCDTGPHLAWRDGWKLYAVHGVRIPADVIESPKTLTVARILAETNSEVRRVMIDKYGLGRFLLDAGAKEIHRDSDALGHPRILRRIELPNDEPLVMVEVINSSPESAWDDKAALFKGKNDRPYKRYFLRVHPELRPLLAEGGLGGPQDLTVHNAVASTFGMRGEDYHPDVET